jgi:hypothetical protein
MFFSRRRGCPAPEAKAASVPTLISRGLAVALARRVVDFVAVTLVRLAGVDLPVVDFLAGAFFVPSKPLSLGPGDHSWRAPRSRRIAPTVGRRAAKWTRLTGISSPPEGWAGDGRSRERGDAVDVKALALLTSRVRRSRVTPVRSPHGRHQRGQPGFMTERQRATSPANPMRLAIAGVIIAGAALAMAGQATADPAVPYPPPPPAPGAPPPPPGQPVVVPVDAPVDAPPPVPVGPPTVPEIQNPVYGAGQTPGQLGYLRDIWRTFHSGNPLEALTAPAPEGSPGPPPGAGSPPQLPPGYISMNAPESNGPPPKGPAEGGPPLPPGYYPLDGPPPPGWSDAPPPDPAAPPPVVPPLPTP